MPCPAAHRTKPHRCWAINPTNSNSRCTHARRFAICKTVARPSMALCQVHSLSKTPHTDWRRSKKDQRPLRSSLGPERSRSGNWTGSNSINYQQIPTKLGDLVVFKQSIHKVVGLFNRTNSNIDRAQTTCRT